MAGLAGEDFQSGSPGLSGGSGGNGSLPNFVSCEYNHGYTIK
jgi:hypothetical protein